MNIEQIELAESAAASEWNGMHRLDERVGAYYRAAIACNYFGLVEELAQEAYAYQLEVLSLGKEVRIERIKLEEGK